MLSEDRKDRGARPRACRSATTSTLSRLEARSGFLAVSRLGDGGCATLLTRLGVTLPRPGPAGRRTERRQPAEGRACPAASTRRPTCCCSTSRRKGVDVGSKAEIYRLIGEAAASGQGRAGRQQLPAGAVRRLRHARGHVPRQADRRRGRSAMDAGISHRRRDRSASQQCLRYHR